MGTNIQASQISITVTDIVDENERDVGGKASVCVHYGPKALQIIISKRVDLGKDAMVALSEDVDKRVHEILAKHETDR